ncbi:MAG: hypothetical protein HFF84_14485 [Oscillibacter sp.]|nr:hypothetical protein [Oscillibacter sp.]
MRGGALLHTLNKRMNIMSNQERHYAYFCNRECEMFPCHPGIPEEEFNCLFCYCPLYALGDKCGGNFTYTKGGIKDCSACLFPHRRASYDAIIRRYPEILELVRREPDET